MKITYVFTVQPILCSHPPNWNGFNLAASSKILGYTGHTEFVLSYFTDIAPAAAHSQEEMEQPVKPSHTVKLFPEISTKYL